MLPMSTSLPLLLVTLVLFLISGAEVCFAGKCPLALATAEFFVHYPNQNVTKTGLEKSTDSLPCIDRHAERTLRRTLVQSIALEMWQLLLCQMILSCGLVIKLQAMLKSNLMG